MKSQDVRLFDVFFLGPVMMWAGIQTRPLNDFTRTFLVLGGAATVLYNWYNYVQIRESTQGVSNVLNSRVKG